LLLAAAAARSAPGRSRSPWRPLGHQKISWNSRGAAGCHASPERWKLFGTHARGRNGSRPISASVEAATCAVTTKRATVSTRRRAALRQPDFAAVTAHSNGRFGTDSAVWTKSARAYSAHPVQAAVPLPSDSLTHSAFVAFRTDANLSSFGIRLTRLYGPISSRIM